MRQLRLTLVVAAADLRRRVRNRSALVVAFVGPLSLGVVFSVLLGGAGGSTFEVGVVDLDRSARSTDLVASLVAANAEQDQVRFVEVDDDAAARQQINDGDLGAAIVLGEGFASIEVLRDPEQPVTGQVAESVAQTIASGHERVALSVATLATLGAAPTDEVAAAAAEAPPALTLDDLPVGGRELSPGAFYGASMAVLFLFFTVGFAARSVLAERQTGTLARQLATPASPGAILAGKTMSVAVLGFAGFVTVWLVTSVLFGSPWGDPVAVLALMAATVLAVAGVATFVASLARTERQADAATTVTAFVLALLGGNFVGPNLPPLLRRLSVLTPNGWALRSFTALNTDAAGLGEILTALAVLIGMGLVFGAVGVVRVRRVMLQ
ncbi:MAG: ABC transporter permease [Acidimicrobiales bacterium]